MKLFELIKRIEFKDFPRPRTPWKFYPSEASFKREDGKILGKCHREIFYKWKQYPPTRELSEHLITTIIWGMGIEEHLIKNFKKANILVDSQAAYKANINDEFILSMRLDGIIKSSSNPKKSQNVGLEIKTYEGEPKYILTQPKEPHLLQVFLYLMTFKPKLPYIIVYYRQRPGHRFQETKDLQHRIDYIKYEGKHYPVINGKRSDLMHYEGIIERYRTLKDYIQKDIVPPKDYSGKAKQCSWCSYKERCAKEIK